MRALALSRADCVGAIAEGDAQGEGVREPADDALVSALAVPLSVRAGVREPPADTLGDGEGCADLDCHNDADGDAVLVDEVVASEADADGEGVCEGVAPLLGLADSVDDAEPEEQHVGALDALVRADGDDEGDALDDGVLDGDPLTVAVVRLTVAVGATVGVMERVLDGDAVADVDALLERVPTPLRDPDADAVTDTVAVDVGLGDAETDGERVLVELRDCAAEGESEGVGVALGQRDGVGECDADDVVERVTRSDEETDGDARAEGEGLGVADGLGETGGVGVAVRVAARTLGVARPVAEIEGDADAEPVGDAVAEAVRDSRADELRD